MAMYSMRFLGSRGPGKEALLWIPLGKTYGIQMFLSFSLARKSGRKSSSRDSFIHCLQDFLRGDPVSQYYFIHGDLGFGIGDFCGSGGGRLEWSPVSKLSIPTYSI